MESIEAPRPKGLWFTVKFLPQLSCPKRWADMAGDETQRFCEHCQATVYNLERLSLEDRLRLLSGADRHVCGRYRVAIRKAAAGHREEYMRHLFKYGAGVAAAGGALITLWQLYGPLEGDPHKPTYLATAGPSEGFPMPPEFVEETGVVVLGGIRCVPVDRFEGSSFLKLPEISQVPIQITTDPLDIPRPVTNLEKIELQLPKTR
jgi:hypothetical protein